LKSALHRNRPCPSDGGAFVIPGPYAAAVEPKHPFAWINVEHKQLPAIVLEWTKTQDVNGYTYWLARCLYWLDGEPKVTNVPDRWITKA